MPSEQVLGSLGDLRILESPLQSDWSTRLGLIRCPAAFDGSEWNDRILSC